MASPPPQWHRRLASRYAAALAAVALGSSLLVAVPMYAVAADLLESALDERLEGTAELVALALGEASTAAADGPAGDALVARLQTLREEADLDALYLVDEDARVVALAGPPSVALAALDRASLGAALAADAAVTPIQQDPDGRPFLSAFAPTSAPGTAVGLRVSASYLARLASLRAGFAALMIGAGALSALLGAVLGAGLTRPIARLVAATERLATGGVPDPPEPGGAAELDALQAAFSAMAGAVRRREVELRALAGAVAHEVRNPTHALRLHVGLLRRQLGPDPAPALRDRLATLERELDDLDATVDGFLIFARANAPRRAPVRLRALLEAHAGGAAVDAPDVEVAVDPVLLGRAVANLVHNAREAGGEPIEVRGAVLAGELHIDVVDHGPGFPAEIVASAFEPFVSTRAQGSGLGLAIVAAVAAAHGGSATIPRSGPDGATVSLRLPAR